MKRAHYFQHVSFEGLGAIKLWLDDNDYQITSTAFYESNQLPTPEEIDFLIIMGGPMSVNDHRQYPWLEKEKAFIQLGKPLLGICLGAQLIASVCGAQIYPNPQKEIGWYPIQSVSGNQSDKFKFDEALTVFHWHGETFDLPQDAKWLACSDACLHQAFSLGSNALALQFHLETTIELSKALIENCADELLVSEYIQSAETMQSVPVVLYERANQALFELLDTLLGTN